MISLLWSANHTPTKPAALMPHTTSTASRHAWLPAPTHLSSLTPAVPLSADELWECERRGVMFWRREGDTYEPPDEDSEAEYEEEGGLVSATNME